MKFIKLDSRGGSYLVVAENVAWLRTAENGQTAVGIVGGQPLLVVGSVEEVAAKILAGAGPEEPAASVFTAMPRPAPASETVHAQGASPIPQPAQQNSEPASSVLAKAPEPEPVPAPLAVPEPVTALAVSEPEPVHDITPPEPVRAAEPAPERKAVQPSPTPLRNSGKSSAAARSHPVASSSASLWERPVTASASGLKIKAGPQRMMGMLE